MPALMLDLHQLARHTEYPAEAFVFVQRGLDFTVRRTHGDLESKPADSRHVSGQQLCHGLRDYAIQEYGLLARSVLKHWNVHSSEDFGHLVFEMVKAGLMQKTSDDCLGDFVRVFDFTEAFGSELELAASTSIA
jgi:uncharacterized repeat protein (TIGR04138 family)